MRFAVAAVLAVVWIASFPSTATAEEEEGSAPAPAPATLSVAAPAPGSAPASPLVSATALASTPEVARKKGVRYQTGLVVSGRWVTGKGARGYPSWRGRRTLFKNRLQFLQEIGDGRDVFRMRRAKLQSRFDLDRYTRFWIQAEVADGMPVLEDATLRLRYTDALAAWIGQFKVPYSRQHMNSSGSLSFSDRSVAAKIFAANDYVRGPTSSFTRLPGHGINRAPGIQLWGDLPAGPLRQVRYYTEYTSGRRRNRFGGGHTWISRLEIHPWKDPGFTPGIYRYARKPRASLDASVLIDRGNRHQDLDGDGTESPRDLQRRTATSLGLFFRHRRLALQGEYYRQWTDPSDPAFAGVSSRGWYGEAAWLFGKHWQLAVRSSMVDPDRLMSVDRRKERGVALTRFFDRHKHKLVLEWRRREDETRPGWREERGHLGYQIEF